MSDITTTVKIRHGAIALVFEVTAEQWAEIDNAVHGRNRKAYITKGTQDIVTMIREGIRSSNV